MPPSPLPRRDVLGTVASSVAWTGCLAQDEQPDPGSSDDDPKPQQQTSEHDPPNASESTRDVDDPTTSEEHHVTAGPGGDIAFEPERLEVEQGATVVWTWDSDSHNVHPTSMPDGADWRGHSDVADAGTTHEHTFDVEGVYEYQCDPHAVAGMDGEVVVSDPDASSRFDGTVVAGFEGELTFDPTRVEVEPGTTVRWKWDSDHHNVAPTSIPEGAEWEGHPEVADRGNAYEYTFDVEGTYEYECEPHAAAGMSGTIVVQEE